MRPVVGSTQAVPLTNGLLDQGWEVTASDYQGEGTPGLLPYIVGVSAARNTIDIVRAARHLAAAHASSNYVVWGHSAGVGKQPCSPWTSVSLTWPDLHLTERLLCASVSVQLGLRLPEVRTATTSSWWPAHTSPPMATKQHRCPRFLTPLGISLLPDLNNGCADYLASVVDSIGPWTRTAAGRG